ncbi:MAG: hypothetical protein K2G07_03900, partial [Muribaculaceae bacterium]|nr:hypothetical protein [Muribaculaceae bacterium]
FLSAQDGDAVDVAIEAGDQVIAEVFNAREGTAQQVANRRYWRLATAVVTDALTDPDGNHYGYIDLSKTDCEPGSDVPQAGDELCQLGNRDDKDRQSAMVFSTVDADAPCVKLYSGINSYTLAGRAVISFGKDLQTGRIFFRLGEDGAAQFLEYRQGDGLTVAGRISSLSTISGGTEDGKTLGSVLDSVGIASQGVRYSTSHTATQPADSTFTLTDVPTLSAGQYLWSRTEVVYNNGSTTKSYAVSRVGTDGATGASYTNNLMTNTGERITITNPTAGNNYKMYPDRAVYLEKGKTYTLSAKTNAAVFSNVTGSPYNDRCLILLVQGYSYFQIVSGADMTTDGRKGHSFTWNQPTGEYTLRIDLYGAGTRWVEEIKIEEGTNPDPQWTPAASEMVAPKITGNSVTYAKTSTTAQPADSAFTFASIGAANPAPGEYLWTRTVVNYSDGSATKSYSVGRIGADGTDGIPGTPGADGKSTYVHYAYANSADGTTGFSTTYFTGALYVGVCTDYNQADPTTPASYQWARLKGEAGDSVYMLDLSDEMMPMPCDHAGKVVGSYKTSQATVYKGATKISSGITYSIAQTTGVSATITAAGVVTPSALTADRGTIVVQAVVAGVTLQTTLSLYKVKPGVPGADGSSYTPNLLKGTVDKTVTYTSGFDYDGVDLKDFAGEKITISYEYEYSNVTTGDTQWNRRFGLEPYFSTPSGNVYLGAWVWLTANSTGLSGKGKKAVTGTLPAEILASRTRESVYVQVGGGTVKIWNIKVERGANADPQWTPAASEMIGTPGADAVVYQLELSANNVTRNALGQLSTSTITVQKYKTTGASLRALTAEKTVRYQRIGVDSSWQNLTAATSSYTIYVPTDPAMTEIVVELLDGATVLDRERIPVIQSGSVETENLVRNSEGTVTSSAITPLNAPLGRWALHEALTPGDTYTFTVWGTVATGNTLSVRVSDIRTTVMSQGALIATLAQIAPGVYSAVATVGSALSMIRYNLSAINIYQSSAQAGATIERIKVEKGANYAPVWTKSTHDIDYLTTALKENGSLEGGLILGALMRLGFTDQKGKYNVTAGMNGIATPSDAPAVWTGGEMIDRAVSTADNAAKAMLRHDGTAYFASNTVRLRERLMQVGDNVQLDESGLSLLADGNTALHIGDVAIESLLTARNETVSLSNRFISTYNAMLYEGMGCIWATGGDSTSNLHDKPMAAGTILSLRGSLSWQAPIGIMTDPSMAVAQVNIDVLVDDTVLQSGSWILTNDGTGNLENNAVFIGPLKIPHEGIVKLHMRFAHEVEESWEEVPGNPHAGATLQITEGTLSYAPGNQTTLGRNGLLAVWGQSTLRIDASMVLMQFGNYALRVSSAGLQKTINGGTSWTNL